MVPPLNLWKRGAAQANRRTELIDALTACITDPRDPAKAQHEVKTMLAQRIYGIALDYEDGNDHQTLREDPIMQIFAEIAPDPDGPLASPATLSRFENWVNRKSLARMSGVFVSCTTRNRRGGEGVCAPKFPDRDNPQTNAPQITLDTNSQTLMKYAG